MSKPRKQSPKSTTSNRTHAHTFMLNDEEEKALQRYIARYRVRNKSRFIRETLISTIMHRFEEDHPTLF